MSNGVNAVFAFVSVSPEDDTEYIVGINIAGKVVTLVGTTQERLEEILPIARMAREHVPDLRLVQFTSKEELEWA